jgi:hypothetical protein
MFRIFVPDQVVIYVQPVYRKQLAKPEVKRVAGEALEAPEQPGPCLYMRVRVFRFLSLPQDLVGNKDTGRKRKSKNTHVEYESDESDTGKDMGHTDVIQNKNHSSGKSLSMHHTNGTLRHRK